jgi:Flp pilus assembly protein TadG
MICRSFPCRRGALTVEAAIVLPVVLFLILALIIGGMGVFRYQQVACQARDAARWTSVRGSQWHLATRQASPTQDEILKNAVLPLAAGMDTTKISIQVEWIDEVTGKVVPWDSSRKSPRTLTKANQGVTARVRVTVTYQWNPGVLVPGSLNLTSVSEMPMSF